MLIPPDQADQRINIRIALTGAQQTLHDIQNLMKQVDRSIASTMENINRAGRRLLSDIGKVAEWGVATSVIYGMSKSLSDMARSGIEVEYALSGLGKVMKEGMGRALEIYNELNKVATAYGVSQIDAIEAATEWARLQENNARVIEGTRVALLAQAVAEMQVTDATRLLISALKQMEIPISRVSEVLDSWNELSNTFAVRAIDLAEAIAKTGSIARQTGVDIGTLNGWITALVQATGRSGREIGNVLKTLGVYAYRVETLNKLQTVAGITVKNMYGQFKPLSDLFLEIASHWNTYNDAQKYAIATAVAGTRRFNEFIVLMDNYSTALRAAAKSYDSLGSAEREAAIRLNTTKMALARASSAMQAVSYNIMKTFAPMIYGFGEFGVQISKAIPYISAFISALSILITFSSTFRTRILSLVTAFMPLHRVIFLVVSALGALFYAWGKIAMHKRRIQIETENLTRSEYREYNIQKKRIELLKHLTAYYEDLERQLNRVGKPTPQDETDRNALLQERLATEERIAEVLKDMRYSISNNLRGEQLINFAKREQLRLENNIKLQREKALESLRKQQWLIQTILNRINAKTTGPKPEKIRYKDILGVPGLSTGYEKQVRERLLRRDSDLFRHGEREVISEEQLLRIKSILEEELAIINSEMDELINSAKEFRSTVLEEDLETQYNKLIDRVERLRIEYEHYNNVMEISGIEESKRIEKQKEGIDKQIQMLRKAKEEMQKIAITSPEVAKYIEWIDDHIRRLELDIVELGYAQKEARLKETIEDIREEYDKGIEQIEAWGNLQESIITQYKGESAAAEYRLSVLQKELEITEAAIQKTKEAGGATDALIETKEKLIQQIELETERLQKLILPLEQYEKEVSDIRHRYELLDIEGQYIDYNELDALRRRLEQAKELAEVAKKSGIESNIEEAEREVKIAQANYDVARAIHERDQKLKAMNKSIQREVELLTALGLEETKVIEYHKRMTEEMRNAAIELGANEETIEDLNDTIRDLELRLQILSIEKYFKKMNDELEDWLDAQKRGIEIEYAMTNDRVAMIKNTINVLDEYKKKVEDIFLLEDDKTEKIREANREIANSYAELTIEIISKWREAAEEFYSTQLQIRDSWRSTISTMIQDVYSGDVVGAFREFQRKVNDIVTDIIVDKAFKGLIERLAEFEIKVRGITPERILEEREIQEMQLQTLMNGGNYIRMQMEAGGINAGNYIRSAIQGTTPTVPVPGVVPTGQPANTNAPTGNNLGYGFMALQVASKFPDWATGRGGGWRAAGYAVGGIIGAHYGPIGAYIGANLGEQLIATIQNVARGIKDKNKTPQRSAEIESLRDQLNRVLGTGEFREAAQIIYNVQNNYNMGFMIPDSQQIRRVIAILKKEEAAFNKNISVQ